jgi:selenide,water dikinase
MLRLNKTAAELALEFEICGGTDITGFSLLGHAYEIALASRVGLRFSFGKIPFISGARRYAEKWMFPAGSLDNRAYFGPHVNFSSQIDEPSQMLLFDAQTSGGLLLSVAPEKLQSLLMRADEVGQVLWEIGEVTLSIVIQINRNIKQIEQDLNLALKPDKPS